MPYLKREPGKNEPINCRILTAALELFVSSGYQNVSVHDVQKKANVSIGSIYNHFGGKEGIAKGLYLHLISEMNEMVDAAIADQDSAVAKCNEVIKALFEYTETRTDIIAYVFYSKHSEYITNQPPICSSEPFKKLREVVQKGMDDGEIKQMNIMIASSVIFGPAIRMIQLRLDGLISEPLPEYLQETLENTWSGIYNNSVNEALTLTAQAS